MKRQAVGYLIRVGLQKIFGFSLYALGAGFSLTHAGMVYFICLFIMTLVIGWILFRANPEILAHRGEIVTNSPWWDKVLLFMFWLINYFVVYAVAGYAEQGEHLNGGFFCGLLLIFLAAGWSTWATLENTFLESTVRLQTERRQTVCTTGPYRSVRHPAYSGLLLNAVGLCLVFPYMAVWGCMLTTAILIVVRTALEDRLLRRGLEGYDAYAAITKYRLLPFIW